MYYGLDIGGSKIELAVFDEQMNQLHSQRVETPTENYEDFISVMVSMVEEADKRFVVKGQLGVGMAGVQDAKGRSLSANVPCATGRFVKQDLELALNRTIALGNDCRLFALSEAHSGAGAEFDHVFAAIIGTGAAGGLVIKGELYQSRQGVSGEYGHFQLPAVIAQKYALPPRRCLCGLPNCFERFIGGKGLVYIAQHYGLNPKDVPEFLQSLRAGDPRATSSFDCYMDILGASFATLVLSFDPDVIVLGGGLSLIDEIVTGLSEAIRPHLFATANPPTIVRAKYGDASGVRGAAIFASQMS